MDLLATVRKEGSRGGRSEFKWSDVQNSSHRENYLGHSLMAPVGRWQKGKDLNWYAKGDSAGDDEDAAKRAADERNAELRKIKEAEQDAMARALGLPVPDRSNANLQEVSNKRDFDKTLKEAIGDDTADGGRGVGFDSTFGGISQSAIVDERIEGNAETQDRELQYALKEYKRRHGDKRQPRHHRSRSRDRERRHHKRDRSREYRRDDRHVESSNTRERHQRRRSRSVSRDRDRHRHRKEDRQGREKRRERSRSPRKPDEERSERRKRYD